MDNMARRKRAHLTQFVKSFILYLDQHDALWLLQALQHYSFAESAVDVTFIGLAKISNDFKNYIHILNLIIWSSLK